MLAGLILMFVGATIKAARIQLTGAPRRSSAFDLTEVTGKQNIDAPPPANAKGTLGVVEVELYRPLHRPGAHNHTCTTNRRPYHKV
ncbi:hypothetical protein [Limnoglobus roseus]|uniref:hypothetical protein n=1 Tax=Limnoglobus roseus TaxID=2598579 RepID=UPI00143D3FB7|nr:hypothetical protein [Limnoglobus roseus]